MNISRRYGVLYKLSIKHSDNVLREVEIRIGSHISNDLRRKQENVITGAHDKSMYYSEIENELYFYGVNLTVAIYPVDNRCITSRYALHG